jgi:tetratricopeptide (TPR) repeat protein
MVNIFKNILTIFLFILFLANTTFCEKVDIEAILISPTSKEVITRHPQIIVKYPADITTVIKIDSIRLIVNNIDYTNYIRIDSSTPEIIVFFYTVNPLNIGKNIVTIKGKLINDDTFENTFTINVNPSLSKDIAYYIKLANSTTSNQKKSSYYYSIGKIYEKQGYYLDALGYYEQAYKLDKNNKEAKLSYDKIFSSMPNKAVKSLNIVLDVSLINVDVLQRNNLYLFRLIIENYRDSEIILSLKNFLLTSGNKYYLPIEDPLSYIKQMTKKNIMTIEDFAISNYLLSKDTYNFEYGDKIIIGPFSQSKIDLMFHAKETESDLIFQCFNIQEKQGSKAKTLPTTFKIKFLFK